MSSLPSNYFIYICMYRASYTIYTHKAIHYNTEGEYMKKIQMTEMSTF